MRSRRCWPWSTHWKSEGGELASTPIGVFGYGEGGQIALYAAALDSRIDAVCVSGYFDDRNNIWRQPIDRNVFGLLEQFGDAEVASLVVPTPLIIEAARGPEFVVPPGTGAAPGRLTTPDLAVVTAEVERARRLFAGLQPEPRIDLVTSGSGRHRSVRNRRDAPKIQELPHESFGSPGCRGCESEGRIRFASFESA